MKGIKLQQLIRQWLRRQPLVAARHRGRRDVSLAGHAIRNRSGRCWRRLATDFVIYDALVSITSTMPPYDDVEALAVARHHIASNAAGMK